MKTRLWMFLVPVAVVSGAVLLKAFEGDPVRPDATSGGSPAAALATTPAPPPDSASPPAPPSDIAAAADKAASPVRETPRRTSAPPALPAAVDEIVHLAQAKVGDEVLLAYIEKSTAVWHLNSDQVLYLHDLGLSAPVIAALVRLSQSPVAGAATNAPAPSIVTPAATTSAPPTQVVSVDAEGTAKDSQQATYNYFYDSLSPYGEWIEVPEYGWCWRPTVAVINPGWRPYCDYGSWMWTDCGWYWRSYYSWGWAPFHYGRWYASPACGWVWYPGTVWGPSWVTWSYSAGYCGWAPLPPACGYSAGFGLTYYGGSVSVGFGFGLGSACYTYVPSAYFCHSTPWYYACPVSQNNGIYGNCTVVNNYIQGNNNNVVVNVGPGTDGLSTATRSEIRKVSVTDAANTPGGRISSDRISADGSSIAVYRPRIPNQSSTPPREILGRQEEARKRSETLARSDVVKLAEADAARPGRIAPQSRSSSSLAGSTRRTPELPSVPQGTVVPASRRESPGTAATSPAASSRSGEPRSVPSSRSTEPRSGRADPVAPQVITPNRPSRPGSTSGTTPTISPRAAEPRPSAPGQNAPTRTPSSRSEIRNGSNPLPPVTPMESQATGALPGRSVPERGYQPRPPAQPGASSYRGEPRYSSPSRGQFVQPVAPRQSAPTYSSPPSVRSSPPASYAPAPRSAPQMSAPSVSRSSPSPSQGNSGGGSIAPRGGGGGRGADR